VHIGTERILESLERHHARGTFFVLGWIAKHHPRLVRDIVNAGHEIGCHGYAHQLVYEQGPEKFRQDVERSAQAIEDACGVAPRAFRAASYSITAASLWALEILVECGFTHDSSIYPIHHDRYGIPGYSRHARTVSTPAGSLIEVPIATVQLSKTRVAPVGGGAYLRLFPYRYTAAGLRRINRDERQAACVYVHPWELDPDLPHRAPNLLASLRTYTGLAGMAAKFERLLSEFEFSTISAVHPAAVCARVAATAAS
jgi:polysaccharide deacetylase family protein (PEP-CTERM system associated)